MIINNSWNTGWSWWYVIEKENHKWEKNTLDYDRTVAKKEEELKPGWW